MMPNKAHKIKLPQCRLCAVSIVRKIFEWISLLLTVLKIEVRVESTFRDLRECLTKVIKDRDYCKEILDPIE